MKPCGHEATVDGFRLVCVLEAGHAGLHSTEERGRDVRTVGIYDGAGHSRTPQARPAE